MGNSKFLMNNYSYNKIGLKRYNLVKFISFNFPLREKDSKFVETFRFEEAWVIRKILLTVALVIVVLIFGCQRYKNYFTPVEVDLNRYSNIHIQWIDFAEKNWRVHGYDKIDDWKKDIEHLNRIFQENLENYWLAGKDVTFSKDKDSTNYPKDGLLVAFDDVYIDYDHYYLYLSIKFIDLSSNKLLMEIKRKGYFGNSYGFIGYLTCSLDNVSQRITWVIMQKKKRNYLG